jgi:hypothetical protein
MDASAPTTIRRLNDGLNASKLSERLTSLI